MPDPAGKGPLNDLDTRIKAAKMASDPERKMDDHHSGAHLAWRMVIELVAGIVIGFGIGYGMDVLFGTLPIFLVLFILLGFVAGVKTMLRTAQEVQVRETAKADEKKED
jgi:ATP synthase protein I